MARFKCPECGHDIKIARVMTGLICNRRTCEHHDNGRCELDHVGLDDFGKCMCYRWKEQA
jgi:hypothetical protein